MHLVNFNAYGNENLIGGKESVGSNHSDFYTYQLFQCASVLDCKILDIICGCLLGNHSEGLMQGYYCPFIKDMGNMGTKVICQVFH